MDSLMVNVFVVAVATLGFCCLLVFVGSLILDVKRSYLPTRESHVLPPFCGPSKEDVMSHRLLRDVKMSECHWLPRDLRKGETVSLYQGHTYGCISPGGVAVNVANHQGFTEIPMDALVL